jgi:hypothetical protein
MTQWIQRSFDAISMIEEGIIYLAKIPDEFKVTYIDAKKEWF